MCFQFLFRKWKEELVFNVAYNSGKQESENICVFQNGKRKIEQTIFVFQTGKQNLLFQVLFSILENKT